MTNLTGSKLLNYTAMNYESRTELIAFAVASSHVLPPVNKDCAAILKVKGKNLNFIDSFYTEQCVIR